MSGPHTGPRASIKGILAMIAEREGFGVKELIDRSRFPHIVRARQEAMYLCARDTGLTMGNIAKYFQRDTSTVRYGVVAHARRNGLPMPRGLNPKRWERWTPVRMRAAA